MKLNERRERKPIPTSDYMGGATPPKATKTLNKAAKRKAKAAIESRKQAKHENLNNASQRGQGLKYPG